ncbi:MAG TPA: hypothetical protein VMZ03_14520 [Chitinophagaceae bacterium]|nr:hypothetical protein [Chitinophagaceae bacterium]
MNLEYKYLLEGNFHPGSRVWIYQASRLFNLSEALEIEEMLKTFTEDWKSHGTPVKGAGYLFFGQFIVLMADERATGVSGCSTDSSVRLIKDIEQQFSVHMFDRTTLAFIVKDKPDSYRTELLPLSQLQYAIDNNFIDADTLYFNNLVETKEELENNWMVPVKDSWLAKRISLTKIS